MRDCPNAEVRDLLPDLVHGSLDAARCAEVEAHVAGCEECTAELALLRTARLALLRTPAIDVGRVARAATGPTLTLERSTPRRGLRLARASEGPRLHRDALPPSVRRAGWSWTRWRAAAAILVVAVGTTTVVSELRNDGTQPGMASAPAAVESSGLGVLPAHAHDSGTAAGAGAVASATPSHAAAERPAATALPSAGDRPTVAVAAGMAELSDAQLQALLQDIDQLDALPSPEPESLMPAVGAGGEG